MRGGDRRRDDAQVRAVWGRMSVEKERCAALCCEVPDVDVHWNEMLVFSPSRRKGKMIYHWVTPRIVC